MIEKQPKYNLAHIKRAFRRVSQLRMTYSAIQTQYLLGFSDQDVVATIQALTGKDFYKSMPPLRAGFTAWQDVYKPLFKGVELYIKFQVDRRGEVIVSFKEK